MKELPIVSIGLGLVTLVCSIVVAFIVSGSFIGTATMIDLNTYGGITVSSLSAWEIWRLFTCQLVHAKQYHMFYNVLSIIVLGFFLERRIGWGIFLIVWFLAGASGTLYSTLFVEAPWNTGTGASQGIFGLAGFGIILTTLAKNNRGLVYALLFVLIPAFSLDLIFANYPKPGHVLGLALGMLLGVIYINKLTRV
ncbi:rhomboid family intramembrane serine protease [Teredinibacter franksiae]|uniref:rhomboid family intramembrane serine protease n=1 Tax=Teredinibacter franksiae TaxID=2761453 RepID=UPI0016248C3C|nr:rhomboid family intramembrane serine protease [Teredinibacter franksiae]